MDSLNSSYVDLKYYDIENNDIILNIRPDGPDSSVYNDLESNMSEKLEKPENPKESEKPEEFKESEKFEKPEKFEKFKDLESNELKMLSLRDIEIKYMEGRKVKTDVKSDVEMKDVVRTEHKNDEEKKRPDLRKFISFITAVIIITISIICIYVFVNIKLISMKDECYDNLVDERVVAKLYEKDDWYVFRYRGYDCPAPKNDELKKFSNGSSIFVYISDNLEHCSLDKEKGGCSKGIGLFNGLLTTISMIIIFLIMKNYRNYCNYR